MIPILEASSFQVRQEYLDQYRILTSQNNQTYDGGTPYAKLALEENNESRNRYSGVLPYQKNIFQFLNPSRYFNASRVLQGRAISCQGPLDNEHEHFWKMVWESKTTAVIMLTDLVEKKQVKCSWYLPSGKDEILPSNDELSQEEVIIVLQRDGPSQPPEESPKGFTEIVERHLELEYKGEKRIVTHYHLRGWGDFQAAPEVLLAKLVLPVWEKHYSRGEHIIAHCSAGIGRSGTFLATLETFSQLKKMPVLTKDLVLNIVKQLRSFDHGREGMVQTVDQYGLIFKTVIVLDINCAQFFCT